MKHLLYFFILFVFISCDEGNNQSDPHVNPQLEIISKELYQRAKDSIKIIAHGGASAYEPFNSIASFKKAFELSADGIELDLVPSADDSIMVFHDLNTKIITGADYNMVDTNAAILRTLNIGKGEKMPFLNEVFEILPHGKKIYLEVKWYQDAKARNNVGLIDKLIGQIEKSGRINDCVILCFDYDYLSKIKLKKPELKCFWITGDGNKITMTNEILSKYHFEGVNVLWSIINSQLSNSLETNNKFLFAWTINDGAVALDLCQKYKVNGIYTDKPDVIRLSLAKLIK